MRNSRKPQKHGPGTCSTDWQEKLSLEDVISLDEIFLKLNPQRCRGNTLVWVKFGEGFFSRWLWNWQALKSQPWIWNNETTEVCEAWTASGQSVSWVGCAEAWIWKYLTRKCRQFSFLYLESPDVTSKPNFAELKNEGSFYKQYFWKWFILRAIWRFHPVLLVPKSLRFKSTHDSCYLMHSEDQSVPVFIGRPELTMGFQVRDPQHMSGKMMISYQHILIDHSDWYYGAMVHVLQAHDTIQGATSNCLILVGFETDQTLILELHKVESRLPTLWMRIGLQCFKPFQLKMVPVLNLFHF